MMPNTEDIQVIPIEEAEMVLDIEYIQKDIEMGPSGYFHFFEYVAIRGPFDGIPSAKECLYVWNQIIEATYEHKWEETHVWVKLRKDTEEIELIPARVKKFSYGRELWYVPSKKVIV